MAPNSKAIMAAKMVHMPVEKLALLPLPSLLTWRLIMPHATKSVIITTKQISHATNAVKAAKIAPQNPAPRAMRNAMKETPQAIG
jgi:hypothetical protein